MTSVTIPNSITSIGESAFAGCNSLKEVHITDIAAWCQINFYNYYANPLSTYKSPPLFLNGTQMHEIIIPDGVSSIKSYAFYGFQSLTSLTIPNNVKSIGNYAFGVCTNLTSLTIPNSVNTIGFGICSNCVSLQTLKLGDGIQEISGGRDYGSFSNLPSLKEVRIGSGIKKIGNKTFSNCQKLEDVYCYAVKYPTTAADAFQNSYIDYVTLHVPASGVEQYGKQEPWSGFMKIVPIEAEPCDITLSDAGYATYYTKYFDTVLPAGVKASVVTSASDSRLTYQVIADGNSGGIVPAGTAVLLQGKSRSADTYTLTPKESTTSYTGENLLHGSDEATVTTADGDCLFYKLAYGPSGTALSNTLGWFWGEEDGKPFAIEGHKAWLAIPKGSAVKPCPLFYSIDGNAIELDGLPLIPSQGGETSKGDWYDLQGRKLNVSADETPALPGVYIRNGKKVLIK